MTPCAFNVNGNDFGEDTYPMVQNNKVLTVSYGTFSCTLEGFDDSFGTMKAIAEYFRDLASDDRYFGAEPPQPDAEMLARIAQREVARQVEARTSSEGIHLRAATLPVPAAETPPQPVDDVPQPQTAEPVFVAEPPVTPSAVPAEPQDAISEAAETAAPKPVASVAKVQVKPTEQAPPPAAPSAPAAEAVAAEPVAEPESTASADGSAESIAAKLRRIREVVAKTPTDEFNEDQHADQVREEAVKDITNALSADHDADHIDINEYVEGDLDDAIESDRDEEIANALSHLDLGTATAETEAPVVPNAPEGAVEFFSESNTQGDEDVASTDLEDEADSDLNDGDQNDIATEQTIAAAPETDTPPAAQQPDTAQTDTPKRTKRSRIVRVTRRELDAATATGELQEVADAEENAPVPGTDPVTLQEPEMQQEEAAIPAPKPQPDSSLSPDDEAELLAELAAVEADLLGTDHIEDTPEDAAEDLVADGEDEDATLEDAAIDTTAVHAPIQSPAEDIQANATISTPAEAAAAVAVQPSAKRGATSTADSDIARLMASADERLEDPENTTSRETYSQLRAVMAAASSERGAGGALENKDEAQVYRDDLASVVRPRRPESRPEARDTDDQRPAKPSRRPAPLKLVQEQRIDDSAASPAAPVRPRRVSAAVLTEDATRDIGSEGGFAAYAEKTGAVELAELLEAAAAYMSFVEGRDHFSRPQLMNKVRDVDGTEFNREDGLRSFGQLLRDGKIERADNGRFTASGQIGFKPGNRAAG
ncbi:chemotaxis protein CheA [Phaeobacter sp. C3_T13_0]|uniref:chemotaxis protein CheA n=1 Tax=Phaeobacter cretensis TaxID=3342641 RepID=UPI0039BC5907